MSDTNLKRFREGREEDAEQFISSFLDEATSIASVTVRRERLENDDDGATIALWAGTLPIAIGVILHDPSNNVIAVCVDI